MGVLGLLLGANLLRDLSRRLAGPVRLVEIDSLYGHDAFLKETEVLAPILREVLS